MERERERERERSGEPFWSLGWVGDRVGEGRGGEGAWGVAWGWVKGCVGLGGLAWVGAPQGSQYALL